MQSFNSANGVAIEAWHLLSTSAVYCPGCHMMFSVDGFRAHTPDGRCSKPGVRFSMAPSNSKLCLDDIISADSNYFVVPCHPIAHNGIPPALAEYHPSSNPPPHIDYFANSMIGRALLEWNSRIGVSVEAWFTVITAFVHCTGCDRVRSFDGDCLHRNADGKPFCGGRRLGLGEEEDNEPPIFGKGKGRAI